MPDPDIAALKADPRVIWVEDVLRFGDTDSNGHINNSIFSVLAESGRVNLFRTRFADTRGGDGYFVIAKLTIEYRSELHYPGRVLSGTWVRRIGRSSIHLAQVLLAEGERLAATAEAVCVSMSRATRRPAPFTDEARLAADLILREDDRG